METEYERSRIERLKRGLYAPESGVEEHEAPELTKTNVDVAETWEDAIDGTRTRMKTNKPKGTFVLKSAIIVALLAVLSAGSFFVYTVWDPFSRPSDKNIVLGIEIPTAVPSGTASPIRLSVTNSNRIPLEYATLSVVYPAGTKSGEDPEKDLRDDKKVLGLIDSGAVAMYDQRVIFLGEENSVQQIHFKLEYRFKGINSIFTKDLSQDIRLNSSPVNVTVNTLKEVNSGQALDLEIIAASNTIVPLSDLIVKTEFPQGFSFADASPKPTYGSNAWKVGKLKPGESVRIRLRGVMTGDDGQQRVFKTAVGAVSDRQEREIATTYGSVDSNVAIKQSFIGIGLLFDGVPVGDTVGNFGKRINGAITWKNNLDARIVDAQIDVKLSGTGLNRRSVSASDGGFYSSSDDTVSWDQRGVPALSVLDAKESGKVTFTFFPLPPVSSSGEVLKNPEITAEITVRGTRISETGVPEEIKTVSIRTVKVTSNVQFASRALHFVGPIVNRGEIPPKVEQETTYTVAWSIVNTSNDIANAAVRAVLPPYIRFTGTVYPSKENIVYNDITKEIVWSPGSIPAGVGVGTPPREVYFQVMMIPSLSQIDRIPPIVAEQHFTAQDAYTGAPITQNHGALTTDINTDSQFKQEDAKVVP